MTAVDLLVVGGSGMLGRELVRLARAEGRAVSATFRRADPGEGSGWIGLDLADPDAIRRLVADLEPRTVVNAAYVQHGDELASVTAGAPGHLAAAAVSVGARFVHISSDVVFSGETARAHTESDPVAPITDYGRAKAAAEQAIAAADRDETAVIVRTSLLWGTPDGPQERLVADPDVAFFINQVRCPLRVDRLAAAVLELTDRPDITGLLHAAGAEAVTRLEFARRLAPLVGVDPETLTGAFDDSGTRPNHLELDSRLARGLLRSPLPGIGDDASR